MTDAHTKLMIGYKESVLGKGGKYAWGNAQADEYKDLLPRVSLTFPQTGYVNYKDFCILLTRAPHRQWKVPYNVRVAKMFVPNAQELKLLGISVPTTNNPDFVHYVFNRKYATSDEAWDSIASGDKLSVALSRRFAVVSLQRSRKPILYMKKSPIGVVNGPDNVVLSSGYEIWQASVSQFFKHVHLKE
jgi:hypothetical protein